MDAAEKYSGKLENTAGERVSSGRFGDFDGLEVVPLGPQEKTPDNAGAKS